MKHSLKPQDILKGAIISGLINAVINGLIYWFQVKGKPEVLLTDNTISSTEHTVFSGGVILASSLAFILSTIAYFTTKIPGKPAYFPNFFLVAMKNTLFAFGAVVVLGVLIQRFLGTVSVSILNATIITALIAGVISGMVDYYTKMDVISKTKSKNAGI